MKKIGVVVPVATPCDSTGGPDLPGLKAVCSDMLSAGCHGLFVAGSTGRGPWFSRADRMRMCRTVADCAGDGVPVLAGCMAPGLTDMLDNARAMADSGATMAVVTAPGYFTYDLAEVETIFLKFADASKLPVIVYDIPAYAGIRLNRELVLKLASHGNIVGFKDSSADMDNFRELLSALAGADDFILLQGKEPLLKESLDAGASGMVVSFVHFFPKTFVALYEAVQAGDDAQAQAAQDAIGEVYRMLMDGFDKRPASSTLFHLLDVTLRRRGVCDNVLLDHDGATPDWLVAQAEKTMGILERAVG